MCHMCHLFLSRRVSPGHQANAMTVTIAMGAVLLPPHLDQAVTNVPQAITAPLEAPPQWSATRESTARQTT